MCSILQNIHRSKRITGILLLRCSSKLRAVLHTKMDIELFLAYHARMLTLDQSTTSFRQSDDVHWLSGAVSLSVVSSNDFIQLSQSMHFSLCFDSRQFVFPPNRWINQFNHDWHNGTRARWHWIPIGRVRFQRRISECFFHHIRSIPMMRECENSFFVRLQLLTRIAAHLEAKTDFFADPANKQVVVCRCERKPFDSDFPRHSFCRNASIVFRKIHLKAIRWMKTITMDRVNRHMSMILMPISNHRMNPIDAFVATVLVQMMGKTWNMKRSTRIAKKCIRCHSAFSNRTTNRINETLQIS